LEQVGATDHFFELGGDSILSIQVVARCRQAGVAISTRDIFEHPTLADLARSASQPVPATPINAAAPDGRLMALTPIQQWFFEHDFASMNHWNQAFLFKVPFGLDIARLQRCLEAIVAHHDALRLRFRKQQGGWQAEPAVTSDPIVLERLDLSIESPESRVRLIEAHCAACQGKLDIERGPLLHAAHFDFGTGAPGRLFLVVHHLAVDGVSWRILLEDLESAYDCLSRGQPVSLPRNTTSFQQWADRLAEYARSAGVSGAFATWRDIVAAPAELLPLQVVDTLESDARTLTVELSIEETAALLHDVPSTYRTQINDSLLTALAKALHQSAGGSSFLIDMEGHGREDIAGDIDVSRTVGWFTTLFPVRLELTRDMEIGASLKSIKEQLRRLPHRGLSYGLLRFSSNDPSHSSTLVGASRPQVLFNYLGQLDQMTAGRRLFSFAEEPTGRWHAPNGRRTHPIEILAQVRGGKLRIDWISCERQIPQIEVQRLANDFLAALQAIIVHCKSPGAGGRTPADFPLVGLGQVEIDELWRRYPGLADVYSLTPMQRLFYVMEKAGAGVGIEQWQFRVGGRLEPRVLRRAFEQIVARHPILRTAFLASGQGEPIQIVLPAATIPWHEDDWRDLDDRARELELQLEFDRDARTGLDLTSPPLMRVTLVRLAEAEWRLIWTTHHLCIDGWSWPRVFKEIADIYAALEEQRPPELEPAAGFGSYVGWLKRRHESLSETYWKGVLAGLKAPTPLSAASAVPVDPRTTHEPVELTTSLPRPATEDLRALARANQTTLGTLIQGGWALLLSHYSGSNDVLFGASFSGRPEELHGVENLIGPCVTNVPVRVEFARDESIESWLARLQRQQLDLQQHQYTPIDVIQNLSSIPWHSRLFESLVVVQNYRVDADAGHLGKHARIAPIKTPESTIYALTIVVMPADELKIKLIYNPNRLRHAIVEAFKTDLTAVLTALGTSLPNASVGDVLTALPNGTRGTATAVAEAGAIRVGRNEPTAAPRGEVERRLAEIWRQLLGQKPIGIDDNFFDVGGQSILLVRAHRLIEENFGRNLPIVALLQFPTIRALATQLAASPSGPGHAQRPGDAVANRARKQREALARQRNRERPN
jgi:non-ribosomal peptide synthase protein (TIGR01720 family)